MKTALISTASESFEEMAWIDPRDKLWGFHVHQELPLNDFTKAVVIQHKCAEFLSTHNIPVNNDDVIEPGYGPHLDYMWELRVEDAKSNVLEKMGLAISYMAINRFGLSAYIHPLLHDPALPEVDALEAEGRDNQANALWFSYRVPQNQDFFFNPPKDNENRVVDTRTSRVIQQTEKHQIYENGMSQLQNQEFKYPENVIINGFHIHMDYSEADEQLALTVFDHFVEIFEKENLLPTSTSLYGPGENGPHVLGGWEVKFETKDSSVHSRIGIAIGWLMCNRQGLSVFMHPVTWQEGDHKEELKAHKEYSFFLGSMPELDLSFFSNKITVRDML